MLKKGVFFICLAYGLWGFGQSCPVLSFPSNGAQNIPVNATMTWPFIPDTNGYLFSLGTTPGGQDILNSRSAGFITSFTPELGLPSNTLIYATLSIFMPDNTLLVCPGIVFRTETITRPPSCTQVKSPYNGAVNIETDTRIEWNYAYTATGYRISIGTTSGGNDIVADFDVGNRLTYTPDNPLPIDTQIFVTITPYNENGSSLSCPSDTFTTGLVDLTCEPDFNYILGRLEYISPQSNFPNSVTICSTDSPSLIESEDEADGYRWYRINDDNSETLLSTTSTVSVTEIGNYRYETYNLVGATECATFIPFTVQLSELAEVTDIEITRPTDTKRISLQVNGLGNYEFAIDNSNGVYQNTPIFNNVDGNSHIIYVRDKNGCGITEVFIERDISLDDFPKFFTPNGDGINDLWQFVPPSTANDVALELIHIYDRYGLFLAQLSPTSPGWDGNFNGRPMPPSDYWFRAVDNLNNVFKGHFTLKR